MTLSGNDVNILSNGTTYTLTHQTHVLKVNGHYTPIPYSVGSEVGVEMVVLHKLEYIYVWLGVGIHLLYGEGGVRLTVSGYYADEMAGLCGNADGNVEHEMIMPDLRVADGKRDFVGSWNMDAGRCEVPPLVEPVSDSEEAVAICNLFFTEMAKAHRFIGENVHYHNACVYDARSGKDTGPSVYAYVLAANALQMKVDGETSGTVTEFCGY